MYRRLDRNQLAFCQMAERAKFVGVNSITFNRLFRSDEDCLQYLSVLKWEDGYSCKRCRNEKYCQGKKPLNRRCTKCRYEEVQELGGMIKVTTGLDFLKDVCIDTHFVHRGRFIRMAQVIVTNPTCIGLGIERRYSCHR